MTGVQTCALPILRPAAVILSGVKLQGARITTQDGTEVFRFNAVTSRAALPPGEMAGILTKPELTKAEKLVSDWKPQPTALTLKAMRGVTAAEELLKTTQN